MTDFFDLTPSPRLLEVLGDIPLAPWQCVSELVDNSFDDFLATPAGERPAAPVVEVTIPGASDQAVLTVRDSGRGMRNKDFENALKAGYSGRGRFGTLGLFGMGFNIATARLGLKTTVRTTRKGAGSWSKVTVDFRELQRQESFRVPVESEQKADADVSGTEISVALRGDIAEELRRPAAVAALRDKLGEVYSYLLRDGVPGLPKTSDSGKTGFVLRVNGVEVTPLLPCIWDASREVPSRGQSVSAVQTINVPLAPAWACQICGTWDRSPEPDECSECGSKQLEKRDRRIHGWLGVQRYLDTSRYGIDFLRHGRKILLQDKSLFTYEDPDTGATDIEYPIEMPANRGRLVGEVHLDHVRVTYQKNDFDRSSQDWYKAVLQIRGDQPMKPRRKGENTKPLAILYSAFRRNDPGLRYLTPGDGDKALHDKAKQWAEQFYSGVAGFQDDSEWFSAAEHHQNVKDGVVDPDQDTSDDVEDLLGDGEEDGSDDHHDAPEPSSEDQETDSERFLRYRSKGVERKDLSGPVSLRGGAAWDLTVWATREELDLDGRSVPTVARLPAGNSVEVYVHSLHPVFTDGGRDIRDFALLEAAATLARQADVDMQGSATEAASELILSMPDQRFTEPLLRERVETVLDRVTDAMLDPVQEDADTYWASLSADVRSAAEERAAARDINYWEALIQDGGFVAFVSAEGIAQLVRAHPGAFLDGKVFRPAWRHWKSEAAKQRSVEKIARSLEILGEFLDDSTKKSPAELTVVRVLGEQVLDLIRSDDEY